MRTWQQEIFAYLLDHPEADRQARVGRRKVKVVSYRKRRCDYDNFVGGLKPCIDGLKLNGLIIDDSEKYIDLEPEQKLDRNNIRTEIFISLL